MVADKRNRRFRPITTTLVATILSLGALTVPLTSAKAQLYFGFGPEGFGFGIGVPAPAPYYYPPYLRYAPVYPDYYYDPY